MNDCNKRYYEPRRCRNWKKEKSHKLFAQIFAQSRVNKHF